MDIGAEMEAGVSRTLRVGARSEPLTTPRALWHGPGDPQMAVGTDSVARAMRMASGPASLQLRRGGGELVATAWGPGAPEALAAVAALTGELDDPTPLVPQHPLVAELVRRLPGARLTSGSPVIEVLVPAILGQKVTSIESRNAHRALIARFGEPAPGPLGLLLPPPAEKLARLPYWAFHPLGIERRRADAVRAAAAAAPHLAQLERLSRDEARRRLLAVPGVGPWTAAETMRLALGDPDAVSVGDYNLPRLVCWALAGELGRDDARMLELLEPYRGQRARVIMLIERSGIHVPRFGPRLAPRSIAAH
jgi:3-methyladenine DNA glycosylase/8-oxoguanine DNA glycosylase